MASVAWDYGRASVFRFSRRDAILVALAAVHAALLAAWPHAPLIALGVWWNSNTIAHNFIHRPFFRSGTLNRGFSAALSVLLGIPQALWRDRHLAHHAGVRRRLRLSRQLEVETGLVLSLWGALIVFRLHFALHEYFPGYLAGLGLCALQGYWEHTDGRPTSHYGRIYNFLCFNDGYHAEHHADPSTHWTALPRHVEGAAITSSWPPLLRWLDASPLEILERVVLRSSALQRFVLRPHRRAFEKLLGSAPNIRSAVIVGGGLFPRTALILRELAPSAHLTLVDANPRNLEIARSFLHDDVGYCHRSYTPGEILDCEVAVIPLCFSGDRDAVYRHPPSPFVLVHDWAWRRRGLGAVVSLLLGKRVNLVRR